MTTTEERKMAEGIQEPHEEGGVPFYPHHFLKEVIVAYVAFGVLLLLVALLPPELGEKANPMSSPHHIKPEWYFLAMYQFLKLFPSQLWLIRDLPYLSDTFLAEGRAVSILLQGVGMLFIALIPFIDRGPERHPRRRPVIVGLGIVVLILTILMGFWGHFS